MTDPSPVTPLHQSQEPAAATPLLLGGEAALRRLVDRFYDLMDMEERLGDIRKLHPPALDGSHELRCR